MGGETDVDPNTHPMTWMYDRQNSYSDEMISFWPLLHPLMDGGGTATRCLARHLLSTWQWSTATHTASCPPTSSNMEIGRWLPWIKKGKRKIYGWRPMPAAYNMWRKHLPDVPGKLKVREWSTSQPSGAGIPDHNREESKSVLCERMLAVKERYRSKTAYEHSSGLHNPLSR